MRQFSSGARNLKASPFSIPSKFPAILSHRWRSHFDAELLPRLLPIIAGAIQRSQMRGVCIRGFCGREAPTEQNQGALNGRRGFCAGGADVAQRIKPSTRVRGDEGGACEAALPDARNQARRLARRGELSGFVTLRSDGAKPAPATIRPNNEPRRRRDNCEDTEPIAERPIGADVIERRDKRQRRRSALADLWQPCWPCGITAAMPPSRQASGVERSELREGHAKADPQKA